jgi:hypothetical protein
MSLVNAKAEFIEHTSDKSLRCAQIIYKPTFFPKDDVVVNLRDDMV